MLPAREAPVDKLFAVIGMLFNVGNDLVFKRVADMDEGAHTNIFYTVQALVIVPLCAVGLAVFHPALLLHRPSLLFGVPVGLLTYITYSLILYSLVASDPSVDVTVYRLNFALTGVLAVLLLHETLTIRKVIGLVLCLVAILIFFVAGRVVRGGPVRGLPFSLGALVAASGLNLLIKVALNRGAEVFSLILYRYVTVALLGLGVALLRRWRAARSGRAQPRPARSVYRAGAVGGLIMLAALFFLFTVVIPISQLCFVFTAGASFVILKEPLRVEKLAGIAAAVTSILVIG
jgi:drug/metabolite transporter (DMT)-like permease